MAVTHEQIRAKFLKHYKIGVGTDNFVAKAAVEARISESFDVTIHNSLQRQLKARISRSASEARNKKEAMKESD